MFSIGYGNRKIDEFIALLKRNEISMLVDIRTKPLSRFQPYYNKGRLAERLAIEGIQYIFMGEELGGKPKDENLYVNGLLCYDKVKGTSTYNDGLQRLIKLSQAEVVCIMCCELKPETCHRKNLVGASLFELGIVTNHITENGAVISHGLESPLKLFQ